MKTNFHTEIQQSKKTEKIMIIIGPVDNQDNLQWKSNAGKGNQLPD